MKVASISDTHIERNGDKREITLHNFLTHPKTLNSNIVILNGDIFDYVTGFHPEYQKRFFRFFEDIERLINKGIKVVFIEGNHDIHIKRNFDNWMIKKKLNSKLFVYSCNNYLVKDHIADVKILFTHGDEIPGTPGEYIRYKEIIRSAPLKIFAHLMPLFVFDYLAIRASKNSRAKSSKYSDRETIDFFRKGAMSLTDQADIIVLGHSHMADDFQQQKYKYFNNGFAPVSRKFFYYSSEAGASLEPLN